MVNKYTIIIHNKTGNYQNYNLFSEKPEITGVVNSKIWTNIYQTAQGTPDDASAQFDMWKNYFAIAGTWKGGEKAGAMVSISQTKSVTLGSTAGDDTITPGTTLNMIAGDHAPSFDKASAPPTSWANAYEVDTGNDFTTDDATNRNFFVGLASSGEETGPTSIATFKPEPGNEYQIQPVNTYYISHGGTFRVGELLDVAKLGKKTIRIDFTTLGSKVTINHNPDGQLVIAK